MNPTDSVQSRRSAILSAAEAEMHRAQRRRVRNARALTAALIASLAVLTTMMFQRDAASTDESATSGLNYAIDFASVGARDAAAGSAIDFAIVTTTPVPLLDTLTDAEAEAALADNGYCVRIMRVGNQVRLVDCTNGSFPMIR